MNEPPAQISQGPGTEQVGAEVSGGSRHRYIAWIVLAGYSLLLGYRAFCYGAGGQAVGIGLWELHDARRVLAWISSIALTAVCQSACFIPVGFMAALLAPRSLGRPRRLLKGLCALSIAGAIVVLIYVAGLVGSGRPAVLLGLAFPMLGCLLGIWMGATWLRGRSACLWFVPKVALAVLLAAACLGLPAWLSLESAPLSFDAARVTSAEKRRLVDLLHGKNPLALDENETRVLQLTEHDLNVLLSWGLSLGTPAPKARVHLTPGSAALEASVPVPWGKTRCRYLNLGLAGRTGVEEGVLCFEVDKCRLGRIEVPPRLLGFFSPLFVSQLCSDRRWRPFLAATHEMRIEPNSVELTYGHVRLPPELRRELFGPTAVNEQVLASTQIQIENLLAAIRPLPRPQVTFGLCFETVFALARSRSMQRDPIKENQAGIFALGVLLGHPRIEEFLGLSGIGADQRAAWRTLNRVVLRGRSDWTKHFCVSAVIAVLSDEAISGAAGLLKEELDADIGGSGFSFTDLLADRAGTTFALQAIRDEASARAMQNRLAGGFQVDEFFPPAADLPEGIPDAQFQAEYGGVGGEAYLRLIEEIERRISGCLAYR